MAFFMIHGFEWEIRDGSWSEDPDLPGNDQTRALNTTMRLTRRGKKRRFAGSSTILDPEPAAVLLDLLHGDFHVWSFDEDSYSSLGLGWSTTPALDSTNKKFGTSAMTAASGVTYTADYLDSTSRVVMMWRRQGSGSFNHYALVLTAGTITTEYKDGVAGSYTVSNWFTANADGTFALLGKNDAGTNTTVQYDDVVVIENSGFTAPMAVAWAAQTVAWADTPNLNITGDCVAPSSLLVCSPAPGHVSVMQGHAPSDGAWTDNLKSVAFTLFEK